MLSWEEFEPNKKDVKKNTTKPEKKEALVQDAEDFEKPKVSKGDKKDRVERAKQAVANFDRKIGEETLAGMSTRVQVDQKAMINCRADLNQLVPFKYDWA